MNCVFPISRPVWKSIVRELFNPFQFLQLLKAWVGTLSLVETNGGLKKAYAGYSCAGEFREEA